jgi:hypothetical protein
MAATVMVLVAPLPASAGGPTSVILVSPGRQATASLYTTDEAYTRLNDLLVSNPVADPAAPDLTGGPGSDAINVTWLVHDVSIWRVDRIFTDAADGPWIETNMMDFQKGGSALDAPGVRHRSTNGKELITLLSALRLLGESPSSAFAGAKAPVPAASAPAPAVTAPEPQVAQLDWLWLLVGAGAGIILVIGFRPLVRRLRPALTSGRE